MSQQPESRTDTELIQRIRSGDRAAFEAVFRAYYSGLVHFSQRFVRSREVAEELVQDLFLILWRRRDRLAVAESLRTYLYRASRNLALNHLRRRRLERRWWERQVSADHEPFVDSDDRAAQSELQAAVRAALAKLPQRCREIFLLSRAQHLTYAEIAGVLGISVKTVETQMGRALRSLRESLGEVER